VVRSPLRPRRRDRRRDRGGGQGLVPRGRLPDRLAGALGSSDQAMTQSSTVIAFAGGSVRGRDGSPATWWATSRAVRGAQARRPGAQLVEVLPSSEYEEDHLPGAINLPLRQIEERALKACEPASMI
jgi:hypothetical protein